MSYYYICETAIAAAAVSCGNSTVQVCIACRCSDPFFGSGAAWPLVIPPFLVLTVFFMLDLSGFKNLFRKKFALSTFCLLALLLLQLVPAAVQVYYSGVSGDQGLNLTGDLKFFHLGTFLLTVASVVWLLFTASLQSPDRRKLLLMMAPLVGFVAALVCASILYCW